MKLSDALEAYFEDCGTNSRLPNFFVEEVRKLEATVEGSSELLESNTVGELLADGLEEIAEDVSKTQEEYQGYVIRIQNYRGVLGYAFDTSDGYGYRDYQDRHVFDTMEEAERVRARKKLLSGVYARVIPNGSREYCRDVEAFVQPAYMG